MGRNFRTGICLGAGLVGLVLPTGVEAKVAQVDERGFVIRDVVDVAASPEEVWTMLLKPARWWDSSHTWSGDAANLSLDPQAGGCFCEILPNPESPRAAPRGSVEHMRVVYLESPRVLRMSGALGPLQADAVKGTLTVQLKAQERPDAGTRILVEYVVGGYMRRAPSEIAPGVDQMLGGQFENLASTLGGAFEQAFGDPDALGREAEAQSDPSLSDDGAGELDVPSGITPLAPEPPKGEAVGR